MNLVFIKDWGTFKAGDIVKNPTAVTKKALVETYRVAKVQTKKQLEEVMEQEIQEIEKEIEISVKKSPQRGRGSKQKKRRKR